MHKRLSTLGDFDHMEEAINLIENFKVEKVIFNCGEFNELEQSLIKTLNKKKISYYNGNENDNSSVIYTEINNHKFLFMGIDILKVGHHGSKASSSKYFNIQLKKCPHVGTIDC